MIESTTPLLSAVSTDHDSPSLTYTFTIEDYMTDVLLASEEFVARPGDEVRWQLPEGVVTGGTVYRWNVIVQDESTTVSNDTYFSYRKPETLLQRAREATAEAGFRVLLMLPGIGVVVAMFGLVLLPWRLRAGLRIFMCGLAIAATAVFILVLIFAETGS